MANIGMVQIKSAQEVTDEALRELEVKNNESNPSEAITNLTQYVLRKWTDAKKAKEPVEDQMLLSIRQKKGEYDADKLAKIREAKQPEIFMNITATKCRNAVAWIKDILFQPNGRIFCVDHTPIPELPETITAKIAMEVMQKFVQLALTQAEQTGQVIDTAELKELIAQNSAEMEQAVYKRVVDMAHDLALKIEDKIDDDWIQYGFYESLDTVIDDIVSLKAGIVKGPVFKKERITKSVLDQTGRVKKAIENRIIPYYERRSPFNIFPSPRSTSIDSGYLFDVISIKPQRLFELIGVPGYSEKEIRNVLRKFHSKELTNGWLELSESAKEGMGEFTDGTSNDQYEEESIYCLELWDEIPGNLLMEWGLKGVQDEDAEYSCCVWMIGNHVIKAMLNYDSLGKKPYSKTSFQILNDSFWGNGLPEVIADCQQVCNACARSILANIGMGALPQVGLNVDRLEPNASRSVIPGKVWPMTDEQIASNVPPIIFYQPTMVTEKLMNVYFSFSKIADEHSGVPAWAHGDSQVGGAGNTAAGLSTLISQASRGIKDVIRNIDFDIISSRAEQHYNYLLENFQIYGLMGDYHINAKGSETLIAKEQQATRKLEYLANTGNPFDIQLVGIENRRKMLFDVAKGLGIELDESVLPVMPQQPSDGQVPPKDPRTLDEAGNPSQGADNNTVNTKRPRQPSGSA